MTKRLLVISTVAMFMISSLAFAGGGKGFGGKSGGYGTANKGMTAQGTATQTRTRIRVKDGSGTGTKGTGGTRSQKRDQSCTTTAPAQ